MSAPPRVDGRPSRLVGGRLALSAATLASVAAMAPAAAVAVSIPLGAPYAGGALPLSVVVAGVVALLAANSLRLLSARVVDSTSFGAYVEATFGSVAGRAAGWFYSLAAPMILPFGALALGVQLADLAHTAFGWPAGLWWPWSVAVVVAIGVITVSGLRPSVRALAVLAAVEVAAIGVVCVLLVRATGRLPGLTPFTVAAANAPDHPGVPGVLGGAVLATLAFLGFEVATPLSEETRDARRTTGRAVMGSCVAVGAFFVATTYAATAYTGPDAMPGFLGDGNPWLRMSREVLGAGGTLIVVAVITSALANGLSSSTATSRVWFGMARRRLLPARLRTLSRGGTPVVGVVVQLACSTVAALAVGAAVGPETGATLFATALVLMMLVLYLAADLAAAVQCRGAAATLPIVGAFTTVPLILAAAGVPFSSIVAPLPPPVSFAGPAVAVVGVALVACSWALERRVRATARR